ncbi:diphthamide biosynthesis protein 3 isoform X1 [Monodelphis domestica]|uniref:diphthamide biosynthesis protein 3 isoform X1 n=1 Tax=Monodelphis domestica TaxID=13616 RepID=UPI0024E1F7A9|nr:diphthamide biosynthesis protein 3 isoform X1 [Monodelphis domestica]
MSVFHDEVEIEDFEYEEETETYFYPCPCGDNFIITKISPQQILEILGTFWIAAGARKNRIIEKPQRLQIQRDLDLLYCIKFIVWVLDKERQSSYGLMIASLTPVQQMPFQTSSLLKSPTSICHHHGLK